MSGPPLLGAMDPKPLCLLNHFTIPVMDVVSVMMHQGSGPKSTMHPFDGADHLVLGEAVSTWAKAR